MDLFDIAVARKLSGGSGGGGGGGDSDFSIAQVTVAIPSGAEYAPRLPFIVDNGEVAALTSGHMWDSGTYTVPMYKGMAVGDLDVAILTAFSVTTSGSVAYDEGEGMIFITGDGTLTITDA